MVSRASPARHVTQTYKVATISPDSDKVPWGAAAADGSIAKARRWMATAQRRYPDMRRADLHSVRPTLSLRDAPSGMANRAGDGRFPGSRGISRSTFPGERPSGFMYQVFS